MGSLKLGLYALTLELAAWGGGLRLASEASDQALAWYLLVHLFASFLLPACAALLLPVGSRRQRGLFLFMMTGFAYGIPVAGFIGIAIGILWLRLYRTPNAPPIFASLQLPDFDPHQRRQSNFRQAGLRAFLGNAAIPTTARIGAMTALQHVPSRVATPLLREVLSDDSEDVRLLAYGLLDNQEKRINRAIDEALASFSAPENAAGRLESAQRLSDLYWELVYQELAQGDLRDYAIAQSRRYCEIVLAEQPDTPALRLRLGRLLHASGEYEAAAAAYRQVSAQGFPATRILPYQAELAFAQRDFPTTQALMDQLSNWAALPRLRPVIDYWTSHR